MSLNIATILQESASRYGSKTALIYANDEISYAQLWDKARGLAGSLRRLGVKPKQHIAVMIPNSPDFTISYFAAHLLGCPVVPLNVMLKSDEIAYHLRDADVTVLIAAGSFSGDVLAAVPAAPKCQTVIFSGSQAPGGLNFASLLPCDEPVDTPYPSSSDDTAVVLYTSGTTGKPKGAELSHSNLVLNAEFIVKLTQALGIDSPRCLVALPLFHSFGQSTLQNATILAGGCLVLMPKFEALAAAQLIDKHQLNYFAGVPTMYYGLLHHADVRPEMLRSLRLCLAGGASLPVEVLRQFESKFNVDIIEAYGLSETSPVASCNPLGGKKKAGTVGKPIWGVEFRLAAENGHVIKEHGVAGELEIKGHNIMKGYYKKPEATEQSLRDGWFATGDVAVRDEDGFYSIVDRKKDMIIRGGFNVYPREVEELLYAHPAVLEAAVVGIADERNGEEVCAFVVLKPQANCTDEELIRHCKAHLAAYKYPRTVVFISSLPKGPTGKILKRVLRDQHRSSKSA